jgi:hypothetical protein
MIAVIFEREGLYCDRQDSDTCNNEEVTLNSRLGVVEF